MATQKQAGELDVAGRSEGVEGNAKRPRNDNDDPSFGEGEGQEHHQQDQGQGDGAAASAAAAAAGLQQLEHQRALQQQHHQNLLLLQQQLAANGQPFDPQMLAAAQAQLAAAAQATGLAPEALTLVNLTGHGAEGQHGASGDGGMLYQAHDVHLSHLDGTRKADQQSLAAAKRAGNLVTLTFQLELPAELADVDMGEARTGLIEAPATADVAMLKRLFMYAAHNKLLPSLQLLLTEQGEELAEAAEDGTPLTLAHYGLGDGSVVTLRIVIPEEMPHDIPLEEALATAAYNPASLPLPSGGGQQKTPSRKTRWMMEQIEALVEGVEKYGLSAWRTIVMDPRLAGKNNMQCKDKFRNLCLTIVQGRPERGLTLTWQIKDRVRALIEQEKLTIGATGSITSMANANHSIMSSPQQQQQAHQAQQHQQHQQHQQLVAAGLAGGVDPSQYAQYTLVAPGVQYAAAQHQQ